MKVINKYLILSAVVLFTFSCKKYYTVESSVVINELLPVNNTIAYDQNGEYDDWFELYNTAPDNLDLSGYYLTDSKNKLNKWMIPAGTNINAHGFLIIWADADTTQTGLHANFKLSSAGEKLLFVSPDHDIIDKVEYSAQTLEIAYARNPDGTGAFVWQIPTFNATNNTSK